MPDNNQSADVLRKRIKDVVTKLEHSNTLDEHTSIRASHAINFEWNRRRYGAGSVSRSKDELESWVDRVSELTNLLIDGIIEIELFVGRIREDE